MADPELAALRAARLNQLQQSADANGATGQSGAGSSEEAEKRRAEEQMKRDLLATALEPAARERRTSHCLLISLILATGMDLANLQCPVLRSCHLRGRVRSSPSSCECYKLDISGGVSASNSSLICSNRRTKHRRRLRARVLLCFNGGSTWMMMMILISEDLKVNLVYHSYSHDPHHSLVAIQSMKAYLCFCFLVRLFFAALTSLSNRPFFLCFWPSETSPMSSQVLTLDRARAPSFRPFILSSSYPSPARALPLRPSFRTSEKSSSSPPPLLLPVMPPAPPSAMSSSSFFRRRSSFFLRTSRVIFSSSNSSMRRNSRARALCIDGTIPRPVADSANGRSGSR